MNSFTAAARLTADAEVRQAGDTPVLSLRLATNAGFGQNQSTLFLNASKFGKGADAMAQGLKKGSFVVVTGELSQREYQKDGQTRSSLELRIDRLDFGPKQAAEGAPAAQKPTYGKPPMDDEIPF